MQWMIGGASFGNLYKDLILSEQRCYNILDTAWELGITTIDTARSYGHSERIIAEYIRQTGRRFRVFTKGRSQADFEKSAEILGASLYAKLWHYQPGDKIDCQIDGVSCYGPEWLETYVNEDISIVQLPWSIIDRSNEQDIELAKQYGMVVVCRSVFVRGEVFNRFPIAGLPLWQWCLQDLPADLDYVIVGVDSAEQLEEIVKAPRNLRLVYKDDGLGWTTK